MKHNIEWKADRVFFAGKEVSHLYIGEELMYQDLSDTDNTDTNTGS